MTLRFSIKEIILLGLIGLVVSLLLPFIMVPALQLADAQFNNTTSQVPVAASEQILIKECSRRIADATKANNEAIRIDSRSTGFRDQLFNVHGYVRQAEGEFDFQCWFNADFSFDTFSIGRLSLEEIQRASSANIF